jgi:hypothetical protein
MQGECPPAELSLCTQLAVDSFTLSNQMLARLQRFDPLERVGELLDGRLRTRR